MLPLTCVRVGLCVCVCWCVRVGVFVCVCACVAQDTGRAVVRRLVMTMHTWCQMRMFAQEDSFVFRMTVCACVCVCVLRWVDEDVESCFVLPVIEVKHASMYTHPQTYLHAQKFNANRQIEEVTLFFRNQKYDNIVVFFK